MTKVMTQPKAKASATSLTFRPGTVADSYAAFQIFEETVADLSRRLGSTRPTSWSDPQALAHMWQERRSLFEHLARTADQFWVAESKDRMVGYARSILRDGFRQLTELFVIPGAQSTGAGRELLARAFPAEGAKQRSIIASTDYRAQALYLKAGVYPRFPIYYFSRRPEVTTVEHNLTLQPVTTSPETLDRLGVLDRELLGYRRDETHAWLLAERQGYLYYRDDRPVGYGYVGPRSGPFALLDDSDIPAVLAHAESEAARNEHEFGLEVPTINRAAMDYLLSRGYRLDTFIAILMSDRPYGKFENYIFTSPPLFM